MISRQILAASIAIICGAMSTGSINGSDVSIIANDAGYLIQMHNRPVNSSDDDATYTLSIDGIDVALSFEWNAHGNDDALTVTPPVGYACAGPCVVAVPENQTGAVQIVPSDYEGM